jgi:hypothetical protein
MKILLRFFFTSAILVFIISCGSSRKVVETPSATIKLKGKNVIEVFDSLMLRQFTFEYMAAKANVDYTDKSGETNSFDVNIRFRRDSIIWISITPLLGIEAARVLITTDSLIILDRVHKKVIKRNYDYLAEMLKTKVNFEMIQAVICGNYFQYQNNEKIRSLYEEEPFIILSTLNKRQTKRILEEKDPTKPVVQDFWIDGNYRIAKSKITDTKLDRFVEATYKDFTQVGNYLFPMKLIVTVASVSPTIMKIDYTKVSSGDTLQMPFTIPEKYELK